MRGDSPHGRVTAGGAGGLQRLQREPTGEGTVRARRREQAARPATLGSRAPGGRARPTPRLHLRLLRLLGWTKWTRELGVVFHGTPGARGSPRLPWGGAGVGPGSPRSWENPPRPPPRPPRVSFPCFVPSGRRAMQPQILEVNFNPDCERACRYHPSFFNDVFSTLYLDEPGGCHVTRLV